ncbi:hypothetical protein I3760_16G029600 [Carya illinoinensis]|nr:hypothetical protein I3760_16G029600 [Carya illinoinensis]
MVPRGPGMNRYLNRENPNTLVEIIADQQIIGPGEDKRDQRRGEGSEGMGPLKTAAEISGTAAPKINAFLSLSLSLSLSPFVFARVAIFVHSAHHFYSSPPSSLQKPFLACWRTL